MLGHAIPWLGHEKGDNNQFYLFLGMVEVLIGVYWMVGIARAEDGDGKDLAPYMEKNSGDEEKKPRRSAKHIYGVPWACILVMPKIKF